MEINTYLSIITLNVNGLNAPIKRHRDRLDKKAKTFNLLPTRNSPQSKGHIEIESGGNGKRYFMPMDQTGKQELQYSYQTKQTLKSRP